MTGKSGEPVTLQDWTGFLADLNPDRMELGLGRVREVFGRLGLDCLRSLPTIEFAGTNGKGSTAALVAASLEEAGVRCGLYTSPHLLRFNERVRVGGRDATDEQLCAAFSEVYRASREGTAVPLTYFEYTTLAALCCFRDAGVGALCLEIGLGGRLDAVNVMDADIAAIVSIGFDHMAILGDTLSKIAFEKAGIIKPGAHAVVTGELPEEAFGVVRERCQECGVPLYAQGRDFEFKRDAGGFSLLPRGGQARALPQPLAPVECAAVAAMVLSCLPSIGKKLPLDGLWEAAGRAFAKTCLPGRMQKVRSNPDVYFDVAHNVPAAQHLRRALMERKVRGRRIAVCGMLRDKDVEGVLSVLAPCFSSFYCASLHCGRGEDAARLCRALGAKGAAASSSGCVAAALKAALASAKAGDEVVVFGSFVTVAEAATCLGESFNRG
ncbi:MAG: bifunctional folylpolyglutamate synthase/dihydrofolate synthase [Succinivibrio sp.]